MSIRDETFRDERDGKVPIHLESECQIRGANRKGKEERGLTGLQGQDPDPPPVGAGTETVFVIVTVTVLFPPPFEVGLGLEEVVGWGFEVVVDFATEVDDFGFEVVVAFTEVVGL